MHRLGHFGGEGTLRGLPTAQTVLDLGSMLRDRNPYRRQLKQRTTKGNVVRDMLANYLPSSSNSAFASCKSAVSKPSVNQP